MKLERSMEGSRKFAAKSPLSTLVIGFAAFIITGCAHGHARRSHGLLDSTIAPRSDRHSERVANADEMETLPALEVARLHKKADEWIWPLAGMKVTSPFGPRVGHVHEGVDLHAPVGTPVYAVSNGLVAYAGGRISGYGKMVVLKHGDGISTVYAHNSRLMVKTGQRVRIGQLVSYSGNTGHSTGPHLHFEIRKGVLAVDPESYLPDRATMLANRSTVGNFRTLASAPVVKPLAKKGRSALLARKGKTSIARVQAQARALRSRKGSGRRLAKKTQPKKAKRVPAANAQRTQDSTSKVLASDDPH